MLTLKQPWEMKVKVKVGEIEVLSQTTRRSIGQLKVMSRSPSRCF